MNQAKLDTRTPPHGMRIVSKEVFWSLVMSEKRDVMPRPERNHTMWQFNQTQRPWGWCSEGYMPSGLPEVFAVVAA